MKFKDYYKILGVERTASADDIKRAYRRLARKYHPDVSKEADAETRFKEMKEAYEVLKDPEKRAAYDQFGADWKAGQDFQPPPDWQQEHHFSAQDFGGAPDFSEFFETLFGGAAQPGRGGFRPGFDTLRMRGEDINARINIRVEDAYHGATRQITLDVPEPDGRGRLRQRRRSLNVRIPKGIRAGQRIRLEQQGGAGQGGAKAGDLLLEVAFDPHPVYEVRGRDIHVKLPVAPWEAALGRTVKAPTPGGAVDLKIPAGANSDKQLRLKGRGLPGKPAGDQYVELKIVLPDTINDEARKLYEQLERAQSFNPRAGVGV